VRCEDAEEGGARSEEDEKFDEKKGKNRQNDER
jgi:hypothetical protein